MFALEDDVFAFAWNTVIGTPLGVDVTATFDQLKADSILGTLLDVDAILSQAGSRPDFLAAARLQGCGRPRARLYSGPGRPAHILWKRDFKPVMPALVAGIHAFTAVRGSRHGWPGQARP